MNLKTPRYALAQDEKTITVRIDMRGTHAENARVVARDKTFGCVAEPFYLPLSFPILIEDIDAQFPAAGEVVVPLVKRSAGLCDLNAVRAQLLSDAEMEEINRDAISDTQGKYHVGLLSYYKRIPSAMLPRYAENGTLPYLEIPDPENYTPLARNDLAERAECDKWDEGMFLDATIDPEDEVAGMLSSTPKMLRHPDQDVKIEDRGHSPDAARAKAFLCELLFAFAYEARTSYDDPTPESAWTICKLCRSLACFTESQIVHQADTPYVLRSSYRRALTFPLYRSWTLCERIRHDVAECLSGPRPRAFVCKMLDDIDAIFALAPGGTGTPEIVEVVLSALWELWMVPLRTWLTHTTDDELRDLGRGVHAAQSSLSYKEFVGTPGNWCIFALECAAAEALATGEGTYV